MELVRLGGTCLLLRGTYFVCVELHAVYVELATFQWNSLHSLKTNISNNFRYSADCGYNVGIQIENGSL